MVERRGVYKVVLGKGKRPPGRQTRKWEHIFKKDLHDVQCVNMDRDDLAQDRDSWWALVNAVVNLQVR
jgi:hypothetical protein